MHLVPSRDHQMSTALQAKSASKQHKRDFIGEMLNLLAKILCGASFSPNKWPPLSFVKADYLQAPTAVSQLNILSGF